jgi:hypothetical protein
MGFSNRKNGDFKGIENGSSDYSDDSKKSERNAKNFTQHHQIPPKE